VFAAPADPSGALPGLWPPVTIGDGHYIDGGIKSLLNGDLAKGYDRVLVVSCFDLSTPAVAPDWIKTINDGLRDEIEQVRRTGAAVEVLTPDQAFLELSGYGTKMLDLSLVP
jgi:NTE family protein